MSPYVSAALQLLVNPATAVEPKRIAYDLALTAQLSDTGGHRWTNGPCAAQAAGGGAIVAVVLRHAQAQAKA